MRYCIKYTRGKEVMYKAVGSLADAQKYAMNGWKVVNCETLND